MEKLTYAEMRDLYIASSCCGLTEEKVPALESARKKLAAELKHCEQIYLQDMEIDYGGKP